MTELPPIEELVPHRHPMLLIDGVTSFETTRLTATFTPAEGCWDDPRGLPSYAGIEIIAQAIAAHNSLASRISEGSTEPSVGVLLGARSYEATMPFFPLGRRILIELEEKMQDPVGFGAFLGTLRDEAGSILASSTIKVFRPADFRTYIAQNRPS
jgi:predicted hotdog family 3-hydroxylacyl-ACP dehydratase